MVRTIHFDGHLAEKYGKIHKLNVNSFAELVSLMQANYKDFRKTIMLNKYALVFGESLEKYQENLSEEQVTMNFGKGDFHMIPEGCGAGGFLTFIAGAVLTVVGVYTGNPALTKIGIALMVSGISSMLTTVPDMGGLNDESEDPDERASLIYRGGVNNIEQGSPIPLAVGRIMAGGALVSAEVDVTEYVAKDLGDDGVVTDFEGT